MFLNRLKQKVLNFGQNVFDNEQADAKHIKFQVNMLKQTVFGEVVPSIQVYNLVYTQTKTPKTPSVLNRIDIAEKIEN